ncbi:hypothetical protein JTB14_033657 [Gonioctena quinquepunctata]|nr:hypothetical protein JTB14_033657 [Gonioctena quinquepunctata]
MKQCMPVCDRLRAGVLKVVRSSNTCFKQRTASSIEETSNFAPVFVRFEIIQRIVQDKTEKQSDNVCLVNSNLYKLNIVTEWQIPDDIYQWKFKVGEFRVTCGHTSIPKRTIESPNDVRKEDIPVPP